MLRRVLVLAVAVLIFAAPLAGDVCHVRCAVHDAAHSRHPGHFRNTHHHHTADSTPTPIQTMSAGRHLCGDTGTFLIAAAEIRQGIQAPATISTLIATVAPRLTAEPIELALDASPPSFLALTSQLRI